MRVQPTANDIPALRLVALRKDYGTTPVLAGVSFDVRAGELFGLIGVNGAGKTTLLKCLLDLCDVDQGSVEIFGVPHRRTAARARLAYLPERFNPPFYLTGRDFLRYMAELHRAPYDADAVVRILDALDLDPAALAKPVRSYSKGMTQKLGLAACLLSGKELQILDEPASGLDPKARALLKRELAALRDAGRTVFFSSHALADVEQLCDRVAVLHGGELRFTGSVVELKQAFGGMDLEQAFLTCIGEARTMTSRRTGDLAQ
jgi:ABC-2 type transport system ATP-binding protein